MAGAGSQQRGLRRGSEGSEGTTIVPCCIMPGRDLHTLTHRPNFVGRTSAKKNSAWPNNSAGSAPLKLSRFWTGRSTKSDAHVLLGSGAYQSAGRIHP